ncbi:PI-PLC X domain-containing protein 1-like isoform X2 [Danio aesculapii]|uniref:PI-PLC X domain-containing protein 1-like isoform X2 n=1 Tax=Danio aesculapii TaxID=1142201 RepID=UPI0024C006F9|nr:PI-PLC X domain-containing protein 1-like isoform X2 [Danio aesculapii]
MAEGEGFADWMSKLSETFTTGPLSHIAIPGSHDAMAYSLDMDSQVLEPDFLKTMDCIFCGCLRCIIKKWSITQEAMIELKTWLGQHSKEVVILAFSHFKEMSAEQHTNLIKFLKEHFQAKICPDNGMLSLKDCWESGYQVILSYDNRNVEDPVLWPGIEYWWANNSDPTEVISSLDNKKQSGRPKGLFAAGLNLTFYGCNIFWNLTSSLKEKTMTAYSLLLDWVKKQHPGSDEQSINIIAADFVGLNSFAHDIIQLNTAKTS